MLDDLHLEKNFESYISDKIVGLGDKGWKVSMADDDFNPNTALYLPDLITYLENTDSEKKIARMKKQNQGTWIKDIESILIKRLEYDGTIKVLRKGINVPGYGNIVISGHYPYDRRIPSIVKEYDENILRVMHQVHYQTAGNKSVDLVFFINGIPVATAEIKTELTQTVQDAVEEYQKYRRPIEPKTRRKNPLLMYKRGAVVHFAISEDEIMMCTDLRPQKPKFLPFNRGNGCHAGNPKMNADDNEYPTGYFWNAILQRDNWLRIFHNFIFEEKYHKKDITGAYKDTYTQIFPRYHQWDCVVKCIDDLKKNGPGMRYLIEHSAGSGKTETMSWLSYELMNYLNDDGERVFSSIIIVTDRTSLDSNIKGTISQLMTKPGLITYIGGTTEHRTYGAKSKALAAALANKNPIIIVTLQTFPFAMKSILTDSRLKGAKFAIIIDEAHSSQGGNVAKEMKAVLRTIGEKKAANDTSDDIDPTDEDVVNEYFRKIQEIQSMPTNVSFFAFTATPKQQTEELFGRDSDEIDSKNKRPIKKSFHVYPMRQAIEEGYILDVLPAYMPYSTASRITFSQQEQGKKLVNSRQAKRSIAHWKSLSPVSVMAKTEFIINHFMKNLALRLNGEAKAMIVTSSRAAVIRYKYAIDAYLKAHPELNRDKILDNFKFKAPGEPLVAFSDKVHSSDCIMPEDTPDSPFAIIPKDYDFTEANINQLGGESIENAFDRPERRLLIVADKFQTGFNQPKLCALYIDKKMANDIEIVQTYSRLNRTYPGKDSIFIIDFCNEPDTVIRAFKKYDEGAELADAQSLDIVYDIKNELDESFIYSDEEIQKYKQIRYDSIKNYSNTNLRNKYRIALYNAVAAPAERWNDSMRAQDNAKKTWAEILLHSENQQNAEAASKAQKMLDEIEKKRAELKTFRKKLQRYCKVYTFLSQIIYFDDPALEVFYGFAKMLCQRLKGEPLDDIDVSNLILSDYRISAIPTDAITTAKDEITQSLLKPMRAGKAIAPEKDEPLADIVNQLNEIWGPDFDVETKARTVNAFTDLLEKDDITRIQIQNSTNSKDAILDSGRMEQMVKMAAITLINNDMKDLAAKVLTDPQAWYSLAGLLYDLVKQGKHLDVAQIRMAAERIAKNNKSMM